MTPSGGRGEWPRGTWGWMGIMNTQFVYDPVEDMAVLLFTQKAMAGSDYK